MAEVRPIAELPPEREVRFSRDVLPVLKKNCLACHHGGRDEGGVILEDVQAMKDSGALTPGDVDDSRLFALASHQDDPVMPPADNSVSAEPLSAMDLALLKRWIESGAQVDSRLPDEVPAELQPLPPGLRTSYAAAVAADGKFAAVGFGNQVELFAAGSPEPLESLKRFEGDDPIDPHEDFVQALQLTPDEQTLISAGLRNLQFWKRASLQSLTLPASSPSAIARGIDSNGRFLAELSPQGELSVASVGSERWGWMKSFSLPKELGQADAPEVLLSIRSDGDRVAVAWEKSLRVVRIDGKAPASAELTAPVSALTWDSTGQLLSGDSSGTITQWQVGEAMEKVATRSMGESPVVAVLVPPATDATEIVVDRAGKVGRWQRGADAIAVIGQLPGEPVSAVASADGKQIFIVTSAGTLVRFDCDSKQANELARHDPERHTKHLNARWRAQVAERLVAAADSELKTTQANQQAEQESVDQLVKAIEAKTKERDEQKKAAEASAAKLKTANEKLTAEKQKQREAEKQRGELKASIERFDKAIAQAEKELAAIKKQKADAEKQLSEIPKPETLAAAIKTTEQAAAKAQQESTQQAAKLAEVEQALTLSQQAKRRGEAKLESLKQLSKVRQQALDRMTEAQKSREQAKQMEETAWKSSQAVGRSIALTNRGKLLTSSPSGRLDLWSRSGQWLGQHASGPSDAAWLVGSENVLLRHPDEKWLAYALPSTLFKHAASVGDPLGESPFDDRVFCLDVDPAGQWLASGGGFPSRGGELIVWKVADQSLVRRFESAHADTVLAVKFSPDGKRLASAGADRLIKIWNVETGEPIKALEGHTNHVTAIDWDVDGRQLASASADQTIKIWDVASGQATRTISDLKSEVTRLVYVGSEQRIGVTTGDGQLRIYRTDNGRREVTAAIDSGYLYSLAAERDGGSFVVSGSNGTATEVDRQGKVLRKLP